MYDQYLCYPSKGLQLILNGGNPSTFKSIIANPADAASRVRNDFPGQTDRESESDPANRKCLTHTANLTRSRRATTNALTTPATT